MVCINRLWSNSSLSLKILHLSHRETLKSSCDGARWTPFFMKLHDLALIYGFILIKGMQNRRTKKKPLQLAFSTVHRYIKSQSALNSMSWDVNKHRLCSFGVIRIRISDPRSVWIIYIKGTGESTLIMDSPVPLMHHDPDRSWITAGSRQFSFRLCW